MHRKSQKSSFRYIAFEGIDGSGKSTQIKLFADYLESRGDSVFLVKEPSDGLKGVRDLILHENLNERAKLFLFLADRAQTAELIKRKKRDFTVLSDRSFYSTIAYQGYGEKMDIDFLKRMNLFAMDGEKPDVVFCFDISVKTMRERLKSTDTIESKTDDFFERVRCGYLELSKREKNFFVIDAEDTPENVFAKVVEIWENL